MNVEWPPSLAARARLHAALGEPARLAIVDRLLLGDASPSELGRELSLASNLLTHHVRLLDEAGLVERSRSEGDQRRTYLRLRPAALTVLTPADARYVPRVVFVCTHNAGRSHLAAALWRRRSKVPTTSAGTEPAARVSPQALSTAERFGLSLPRPRPTHVRDVLRPEDLVVAVCDNAHENLDGEWDRLHWSVPDPARVGTRNAFDRALRDLASRVDRLAPVVRRKR